LKREWLVVTATGLDESFKDVFDEGCLLHSNFVLDMSDRGSLDTVEPQPLYDVQTPIPSSITQLEIKPGHPSGL